MNNKIINYLVVAILLAFFTGQAFFSLLQKNATIDEFTHISAGYSYWKTREIRLNTEHPPLAKLYASLPLLFLNLKDFTKYSDYNEQNQREFGRRFLFQNTLSFEKIVNISRIPILLLGIILGIYVYLWTSKLFGRKAGFFALFLYSFSPNILAHTCLVTTDFAISLFIFVSCYYLFIYFKNYKYKYLFLSAISLGLANITKFTALYILPLFFVFFLIDFFLKRKRQANLKKSFFDLILVYLITAIIIWAVYLPFKDGTKSLYFLPQKYIEGVSAVKEHAEEGHESFFFGEVRETGWWWYYLGMYAIKTPIPEIIFLLLALFFALKNKKEMLKNYIIFLAPLFIIIITSITNKANIGYRHILPMLPFLIVFESQVTKALYPSVNEWYRVKFALNFKNLLTIIIFILSLWYFINSLWIYPDFLMYFNQFVAGPDGGWRYSVVGDDWGQDVKGLRSYLIKNNITHFTYDPYGRPDGRIPSSYFEEKGIEYDRFECGKKPENSLLAVHITYMQRSKRCFGFLENYKPIAKIGYSVFIYDFRK